MDPATPQVLGGTVELYLGGQPIVFNTTTAVFIPKGTPYGPLTWREFRRPHLQVSIVLGSGALRQAAGDGAPGAVSPQQEARLRLRAVRHPEPDEGSGPRVRSEPSEPHHDLHERHADPGGEELHRVRAGYGTCPAAPSPRCGTTTSTRSCCTSAATRSIRRTSARPGVRPGRRSPGARHDPLRVHSQGLNHGPLLWKEVRRPIIEFAMMLGAGIWAEGWEGSFFDLP